MYTFELWTGSEWLSPTEIDREMQAIIAKQLHGRATEADQSRLTQLQAIRRKALIPRRVPAAHRRMKKISVNY